MYNPSALGDPDCYSSSIPSTEVHAAAGPGNHWFYLLAEGTNPTNGRRADPGLEDERRGLEPDPPGHEALRAQCPGLS